MKNWRLIGGTVVVLFGVTFAAGYFYGSYRTGKSLEQKILVGDRYRVVRTPGGMLEVSTFQKGESFSWQTSWNCPSNLCGFLPSSSSQISAEAHYTYRIPLAEYWVLERVGNVPLKYQLKVPKLEPKLPVTVSLPEASSKT